MRRQHRIAAALAALSAAALVSAQTTTSSPVYHLKDEVVVRGRVVAVSAIRDWMGQDGVNVTLQTPEAAAVHVDTAPASFLNMLDFPIVAGDDLEITGAWGQWGGNTVLLAHQLRIRKITLNVRDPKGSPLW